ncbi:hypothetical protein GN244_ATG04622 [Phytophthora infestans]|uniref:M96 mating-specific protein family n=1 Tax=Phytophthora infestans TaxID=4787 RepID=A0A833W5L2_PHYIN|nr:hypothetical protein GN244_ATG04622 [Phytophthora infestans]KAF4130883.1 hypothetical protein GN958_ATG19888 [Phytophthora infestans]
MTLDAVLISEVESFLSSFDISALFSPQVECDAELLLSNNLAPNNQRTKEECERHKEYRKRRRAERERLEQEVSELKTKLACERKRQLSMSGRRMVSWCHLEARMVSEERHRRLIAAVSAHTTLIQQYREVTQGRQDPDSTRTLPDSGITHCPLKWPHVESFDSAFYKASALTFDTIYAQTDEVLGNAGLNLPNDQYGTNTDERELSSGKTYFQYVDKRTFASNFEQSCATLKRTLLLHHPETHQFCKDLELPDTAVAFKFRASTRLKSGKDASVLFRVINRCYNEDNRMVVVWRVFAEAEGAFTGMHADEFGWGVLTTSGESENESIMQRFACYVPMNVSSVGNEQLTKRFANAVMEVSTTNSEEIACRLENLL